MNRTAFLAFTMALGLWLCLGADANAQVVEQTVPAAPPSHADRPAWGERFTARHDTFLADWIGADNQGEIALNQFARQRASTQGVKDFAAEMIRAHSDLAMKLNQAVTRLNASAFPRMRTPYTAGYRGLEGTAPAATPAAPSSNPPQGTSIPAPSERAISGQRGVEVTIPGGPNISVATTPRWEPANLEREIDGRLVTLVEEKLGQKTGREFDRCFIHGQIAAHVHMLATLEVARNQVSPQLKPVLDEAVEIAQKHLRHAESLASELASHESH
jgi:predicted outer membrane protein